MHTEERRSASLVADQTCHWRVRGTIQRHLFMGQTQEVARGTWGPRIKQDQRDVHRIKDYLEDQCQNPFDLDDESTSPINITTGQLAYNEVEMPMSKIPDMRKEILEKFATEGLVEKPSTSWDLIPKMPLVTFSAAKKCLSTDEDSQLLIDTEVLFRRLLAVSKNRDVDMRNVLAYELSAVPQSMFHDDGTLRKTNKADMAKRLEEQCDDCLSYRKLVWCSPNLQRT